VETSWKKICPVFLTCAFYVVLRFLWSKLDKVSHSRVDVMITIFGQFWPFFCTNGRFP
jgi:hypothetical protein